MPLNKNNIISLNTERSYKTRLNRSDCQSKIPNARIGLVDFQRSYFSTFKFRNFDSKGRDESAEKQF